MNQVKPSPTVLKVSGMLNSLVRANDEIGVSMDVEINLDELQLRNIIVPFCEHNNLKYRVYRKGSEVRRRAIYKSGLVKIQITEKIQ